MGQQSCVQLDEPYYKLPDSLVIIPSSIQLNGNNKISFDLKEDKLLFPDTLVFPTTLCFQYLIKHQTLVEASFAPSLYDSGVLFTSIGLMEQKSQNAQEMLGIEGIQIEGAFLRSVSGGQNNGTYMHSALDLRIRGKISDELSLNATLTDQQMPFEPEGNTQRLQDFDRVNIQLQHENWQLEGGDILSKAITDNSFLKFQRQVQGIRISTNKLTFDSLEAESAVLSAISRSKNTIQQIMPIEGVLGPYRLMGPQGENFIFIIAGTEKVFLDGQLLERGISRDYIIDYNAAEITFNANVFISKYSQIQVEFDYSDQQFSRSLLNVAHQQDLGKLKVRANVYQEADNINRPLDQLSANEIELLAQADPNQSSVYISSVDSIAYTSDRAMYALVDTIVNGSAYQIYQISSTPEVATYSISFSLLGENRGDYVLQPRNENYQVFKWIAPVDGIHQGNYAPMKKVVLPQKHRMLELGFDYEIQNAGKLILNTAFTERVFNRFNPQLSDLTGKAFKIGFNSKQIRIANNKDLLFNYDLAYEYMDSTFSPVQNFRTPSFNRDWGNELNGNYILGEEHLISTAIGLEYKKNQLNYQLRLREKLHNGWGNQQILNFSRNGVVNINTSVFLSQNRVGLNEISWGKLGLDLSYDQWWISPGYKYDYEKHEINRGDSTLSSFQNFEQHTFYLSKQDSSALSLSISHQFRNDFKPHEGNFELFEEAQLTNLASTYRYNEYSELALRITRKNILKAQEQNNKEDFYQGAINWNSSFLNHMISHSLSYQTGTGRVLERSYFFQEVALGLGTHSWSDMNGNGLKELEEFFEDETSYGDKNYVKLFNFTNDYQTAFTNQFQSSVQFRMPHSWRNADLIKAVLSRISGQWFLKYDHKNTHNIWSERINPFIQSANSGEVLSAKKYMKSSIYINRGANWSVNLNWSKSERKQLLLSGFEETFRENYQIKLFLNELSDWRLSSTYENAFSNNTSDLIESKNFKYVSHSVIPEIQWQHFKNYRLNLLFEYAQKSPGGNPEDKFKVDKYRLDLGNKWNQGSIGMLEGHIQYIQLNSTIVDQNSPLSYELYEGLRAGENYVWNLSFRRKLIGDLNLTLSYNGRKSTNVKTRQFGSVQLTALF